MLSEQMSASDLPKMIFVTRKFPPHVGGMERAAWEMYQHLSEVANVRLVKALAKKGRFILALPYLLLLTIREARRWHPDVIYLQDATLAMIAPVLRTLGIPIVTTMHGLEMTYPNPLYQFLIRRTLPSCDAIVCISEATRETCRKAGIPERKLHTILYAIRQDLAIEEDRENLLAKLAIQTGLCLQEKHWLLSVGRLIERKGVYWFLNSCFAQLAESRLDLHYVIAGDGEMYQEVQAAVAQQGLSDRVHLLGYTDNETLQLLFNTADLFIMPNLKVPGDIEGFGLVSLEAGSCGLPVVAARVDGIGEALGDKGILLEPGDSDGFIRAISRMLDNEDERLRKGAELRRYVEAKYDWREVAEHYKALFAGLTPEQARFTSTDRAV
ncbi:MAG: glycosyltransferase family 4 protein [Candidatus Geothermincolia bacterium]